MLRALLTARKLAPLSILISTPFLLHFHGGTDDYIEGAVNNNFCAFMHTFGQGTFTLFIGWRHGLPTFITQQHRYHLLYVS